MYHSIKFGYKKISSSETVIFDQMSLHCDPDLEDGKPIFLYDTLAQYDASQYQLWSQKVK